jgi:hypothetical protein
MSDFQFRSEQRERYLYIKGTGIRRDLSAVFESTQAFAQIVEQSKPRFILADYSEVTTITSNPDAFNITRLYERNAPILHELCISIIINPSELEVNKFWEEICILRGFNFKIFTNAADAEQWLHDKMELA